MFFDITKHVKFMSQTGKNNDIEPLFGSNGSYWFEFDFKIISGVVLRSLTTDRHTE